MAFDSGWNLNRTQLNARGGQRLAEWTTGDPGGFGTKRNSGIRFSLDDLKQVNMQHLPKSKLLPATYWKNLASKYKLDGSNKDVVHHQRGYKAIKSSHFLRKTSADEFQHCVHFFTIMSNFLLGLLVLALPYSGLTHTHTHTKKQRRIYLNVM